MPTRASGRPRRARDREDRRAPHTALSAFPERAAERDRPRERGAPGQGAQPGARILGRPRNAHRAALERNRHAPHRGAGADRDRRRLRARERVDHRDRQRHHRAVDRVPGAGVPLRLHARGGQLRGGPGELHGVGGRVVQPGDPRGMAHRPRAGAGHRDRRRDQPDRRVRAVAPRRGRASRTRRSPICWTPTPVTSALAGRRCARRRGARPDDVVARAWPRGTAPSRRSSSSPPNAASTSPARNHGRHSSACRRAPSTPPSASRATWPPALRRRPAERSRHDRQTKADESRPNSSTVPKRPATARPAPNRRPPADDNRRAGTTRPRTWRTR